MPTPVRHLLVLSRETLNLNQAGLAGVLGSSLRTVQRWEAGRGTPYVWNLHKLAEAVRSHDADLALQIDVWAPRPAPPPPPVVASARVEESIPPGLPLPAAPPALPPSPPIPAVVLVDSVVCAAAEATSLSPQAIRPAILAAFARARHAGLTLDAVIAVLAPLPQPAERSLEMALSKGK